MPYRHRLLALLLALVMLCSAFVGCGTTEPVGSNTTAYTTSSEFVATEPEAPAQAQLNIVVDGKAQYSIIRDEDLSAAAGEVTHARTILEQIKSLTGANATLGTDWVSRGKELNSDTNEILIGYTDYPETQQVIATLSYGEWAVRAVGNKIVIFGFDTAALGNAVAAFKVALKQGVSEDGKSITLDAAAIEKTGNANKQLSALPKFDGGTYGAYYEGGNDCDEIIIRDATPELYNAYLKKLESAGYTKYTDHQITDNLFATYTSDKYTVTAGYYDYETSVRLIIEPLAPAVGLEEENVYAVVTTPQMTLLGQEYTTAGVTHANGQCVLIRLSDGRFIIIDGGHSRAEVASNLLSAMKEQSAEYAKSMKDITVAAWIVTHAHGDHFGTLVNRYATFQGITVERILINFLSETERLKAIASTTVGKNWDDGEGAAAAKIPTAAQALGAEIYIVHTGQVFYFADLEIEVLYTIESFAPEVCNALNTTSLVMRMDIAGTIYMSTGDATGNGLEICTNMYGDYLQSDIVQVAHHGGSTWGNNAGTTKAYEVINAPTAVWARGLTGFETAAAQSWNAVLYKVSNYKEQYISGAIGDVVILPMPYTIGSGTTVRAAG